MQANTQPNQDQALAFIRMIAAMNYDGEELKGGEEFLMENDDAVACMNDLIHTARELLGQNEE